MEKTNLVKFIITFLMVINSIIGLNSCVYSWRRKTFFVNYFLLVWCTVVLGIFTSVYVRRLYNDTLSDDLDFKNAVKLYYYLNIIGAAISYLSQIINCTAIVDFFNKVQLLETLNYFDIEVKVIQSAVLLVTLKTIIFPAIIEIALILTQLHDDVNGDESLLSTIYALYPLLIANIIPNCLFGIFVSCRQFTLALNHQLTRLEREANFLQHREQMRLQKNFYRMYKFCNLADKLDELSAKYSLICSQTLSYVSLCAAPFLASLLCNLFGITIGLFRQYNALADTLINEESYDVFSSLTNGVFLIISFLEIALQSLVANQSIEALKETGLILKRIKLHNSDIRFKEAVERFSFTILVTNFKIQPMKLINVDLTLLHTVLSAVTSFLLILIQTDLTLRFSI